MYKNSYVTSICLFRFSCFFLITDLMHFPEGRELECLKPVQSLTKWVTLYKSSETKAQVTEASVLDLQATQEKC